MFLNPRPVVVVTLGDDARIQGVVLASQLRQQGLTAILAPAGRSMKAQIKYASQMNAYLAFIIGENEIKKGTVTVRDMDKSSQKEEPLSIFIPVGIFSTFPTCPICNKIQQGTWERCDFCDACPVHHENMALGHEFEED